MLVAAELLRHDDQTIMIAETRIGNLNIPINTTKEKYDILTKEAMDILKGKGDLVYLLEIETLVNIMDFKMQELIEIQQERQKATRNYHKY